eukprot:gene4896-34662_t
MAHGDELPRDSREAALSVVQPPTSTTRTSSGTQDMADQVAHASSIQPVATPDLGSEDTTLKKYLVALKRGQHLLAELHAIKMELLEGPSQLTGDQQTPQHYRALLYVDHSGSNAAYGAANPTDHSGSNAAYGAANPTDHSGSNAAYGAANPTDHSGSNAAYGAANPTAPMDTASTPSESWTLVSTAADYLSQALRLNSDRGHDGIQYLINSSANLGSKTSRAGNMQIDSRVKPNHIEVCGTQFRYDGSQDGHRMGEHSSVGAREEENGKPGDGHRVGEHSSVGAREEESGKPGDVQSMGEHSSSGAREVESGKTGNGHRMREHSSVGAREERSGKPGDGQRMGEHSRVGVRGERSEKPVDGHKMGEHSSVGARGEQSGKPGDGQAQQDTSSTPERGHLPLGGRSEVQQLAASDCSSTPAIPLSDQSAAEKQRHLGCTPASASVDGGQASAPVYQPAEGNLLLWGQRMGERWGSTLALGIEQSRGKNLGIGCTPASASVDGGQVSTPVYPPGGRAMLHASYAGSSDLVSSTSKYLPARGLTSNYSRSPAGGVQSKQASLLLVSAAKRNLISELSSLASELDQEVTLAKGWAEATDTKWDTPKGTLAEVIVEREGARFANIALDEGVNRVGTAIEHADMFTSKGAVQEFVQPADFSKGAVQESVQPADRTNAAHTTSTRRFESDSKTAPQPVKDYSAPPKTTQPVKDHPAATKTTQPVKNHPAPSKLSQPVKNHPAPSKISQPVKKPCTDTPRFMLPTSASESRVTGTSQPGGSPCAPWRYQTQAASRRHAAASGRRKSGQTLKGIISPATYGQPTAGSDATRSSENVLDPRCKTPDNQAGIKSRLEARKVAFEKQKQKQADEEKKRELMEEQRFAKQRMHWAQPTTAQQENMLCHETPTCVHSASHEEGRGQTQVMTTDKPMGAPVDCRTVTFESQPTTTAQQENMLSQETPTCVHSALHEDERGLAQVVSTAKPIGTPVDCRTVTSESQWSDPPPGSIPSLWLDPPPQPIPGLWSDPPSQPIPSLDTNPTNVGQEHADDQGVFDIDSTSSAMLYEALSVISQDSADNERIADINSTASTLPYEAPSVIGQDYAGEQRVSEIGSTASTMPYEAMSVIGRDYTDDKGLPDINSTESTMPHEAPSVIGEDNRVSEIDRTASTMPFEPPSVIGEDNRVSEIDRTASTMPFEPPSVIGEDNRVSEIDRTASTMPFEPPSVIGEDNRVSEIDRTASTMPFEPPSVIGQDIWALHSNAAAPTPVSKPSAAINHTSFVATRESLVATIAAASVFGLLPRETPLSNESSLFSGGCAPSLPPGIFTKVSGSVGADPCQDLQYKYAATAAMSALLAYGIAAASLRKSQAQ